jgi:hypothetical protein
MWLAGADRHKGVALAGRLFSFRVGAFDGVDIGAVSVGAPSQHKASDECPFVRRAQ